jgi:hypothetical protein
MRLVSVVLAFALLGAVTTPLEAQPLGTFRWQLRPYCNVVSLSVMQEGGLYRLEGTDDQCGNGRDLASVTGLAFPNPDGTIGFGVTIVTAPGGSPVHVDADITLATLGGSWRDSTGATGAFVFVPNGGNGGNPRPAAAAVVIPVSVVLAGGAPDPNLSAPRMLWLEAQSAFRAGRAENGAWSGANIGNFSAAFGQTTRASGQHSLAAGSETLAAGQGSVAFGMLTQAHGLGSAAIGLSSRADSPFSIAMGNNALASAQAAVSLGESTQANGQWSAAIGLRSATTGTASMAIGLASVAAGEYSFAGGDNAFAGGVHAFAFGLNAQALGAGSLAIGSRARANATASGSILLADRSSSAFFESNLPNEFGVRAAGGVYLYTSPTLTSGVMLAPNGNSWASLSDANAKENFRDVNGEDLLRKLAQIPVREWNYKAQDEAIRHMGPTAQDFRAAFGLGDFPLRINTIDADGVALGAIKALEARTRALAEENAALRDRLTALEQLLNRR